MNCITEIASKAGRDYITPEDVTAALEANDRTLVCTALLEVLSKTTKFGWEDCSLCAFIVLKGKK
jgi:hypothetical protein